MSLRLAGPTLASPEPALPGHDTAADLGLQQNLGHQQAAPSYGTDTRVPQALVDKAHSAIAPGLADHYSPKELQDISYSLARHSLEEDAHKGPVQGFLVGKDKRSVAIKYEHQFTQVQLPESEQGAATTTASAPSASASASRTVQTQPGVYKHTDAQGRTTYSRDPEAPLSPQEQERYEQQRPQWEKDRQAEHAQQYQQKQLVAWDRFSQQAVRSAELKDQEAQQQAAQALRQGWGGVVRGGQETITDTLRTPYYVYQSVKTHGVEGTVAHAAKATLELPGQVMKAIEQGDTQTLTGAALGVIPLTRGGKLAAVVDVPEVKAKGAGLDKLPEKLPDVELGHSHKVDGDVRVVMPEMKTALAEDLDSAELRGTVANGRVAGEIKILQGATPDANELRAGLGLAEQFGYEVTHQPTASQLGVHEVRTADLTVKDVGQVDVYTPTSTNPTSIARAIEGKNNQANAVIVQTSIEDADMATVAARTWGKPTAQNIQTIFFQKPDGSIVRFNRSTGS